MFIFAWVVIFTFAAMFFVVYWLCWPHLVRWHCVFRYISGFGTNYLWMKSRPVRDRAMETLLAYLDQKPHIAMKVVRGGIIKSRKKVNSRAFNFMMHSKYDGINANRTQRRKEKTVLYMVNFFVKLNVYRF